MVWVQAGDSFNPHSVIKLSATASATASDGAITRFNPHSVIKLSATLMAKARRKVRTRVSILTQL